MNAYPDSPILGAEEERDLARAYRDTSSPQAFKYLVEAHVGLVLGLSREFQNYPGSGARSGEDLLQEGFVGLCVAIRRFDPDHARGARLATYATWWIRCFMYHHVVSTYGPVRIGTARWQRKIFFNLGKARRLLGDGTDDPKAIARVLGVLPAHVEEMLPRFGDRDLHLDAPATDAQANRGAKQRPDNLLVATDASPEDAAIDRQEARNRHNRIRRGLRVLTAREREVIRARHLRQEPVTLARLGEKLGVSRERVRQIEKRAVGKMRIAMGAP